ncbi:MAG: MmcQ/YjbR family DNA-binding protein [Ignavibacteria bacterium]
MINVNTFKQLALSFPNSEEIPHFEKTSFRINKKIFATLSTEKNTACIKLSVNDQYSFCAFDETVIYPLNNKWGLQGWTILNLKKLNIKIFRQALNAAYSEVVNKTKFRC